MFLINSRYPLFSATRLCFRERVPSHCWHTLSLGYGVNLPSSLAQFNSIALEFSSCPPESVCSTVCKLQSLAAFLVSMGSPPSGPKPTTSRLEYNLPDLPKRPSYSLELESINQRGYPSSPPHHSTHRYRNINLFSIDYAFRPRLRCRLTLGGLPWPRKPWASGEEVSHFFYRY